MNYVLYKNRNTAAFTFFNGKRAEPLFYRKMEDVLVLDVISLLRKKYSKDVLLAAKIESVNVIQKQKNLALSLISMFAKESECYLPVSDINLYSLVHDKMENSILNEKIKTMIAKPQINFSELDHFLFTILCANGFEFTYFNDGHIDYADFLFDPLYNYLKKLSWFEYRMTHFFHLLLSEKEEILSDYHLNFIVFFLQSYYNVFSYNYEHPSFDFEQYGIRPLIEKTDKAFNNLFNFLSRYEVVNDPCTFLKTIRKIDYPRPIDSRPINEYKVVYKPSPYWPCINGSGSDMIGGTCPIFLKEEKFDDVFICDYELQVTDISYLHSFVLNFLEISLELDSFNDRDAEYGRYFFIFSPYIYYDKSKIPIELIDHFDPSQAYNINMDWNKADWKEYRKKISIWEDNRKII